MSLEISPLMSIFHLDKSPVVREWLHANRKRISLKIELPTCYLIEIHDEDLASTCLCDLDRHFIS